MRETEFKALAPIAKGPKKGELVWWSDVYISSYAVLIDTPISGNVSPLKDVKELCQWSGLRDKNDVKIYEDDIIDDTKFPNDSPYPRVIVFHEGAFRIKSKDREPSEVITKHYLSICDSVVVGNIHENKDLLD